MSPPLLSLCGNASVWFGQPVLGVLAGGRALLGSCGCLRRTLPEVGFTHAKGGNEEKEIQGRKEGATKETTPDDIQTIPRGLREIDFFSFFLSFLPYSYSLCPGWAVFCGVLLRLSFVRVGTWNRVALPSELGGPVENSSLN